MPLMVQEIKAKRKKVAIAGYFGLLDYGIIEF